MTTLGTLQGTNYRQLDGTQPPVGKSWVVITTNILGGDLRDPVGNVIWSGSLRVPIVSGTWSVQVPPTDDPTLSVMDFVYTITEELSYKPKAQWRTVSTSLPSGATVNMADLASGVVVPPSPPEQGVSQSQLTTALGALPATFASLNEDGELVIDGVPVGGSGGGGALVDRGVWTAATAYATGDVVTWQARRWCCGTAHTSGSDFDSAKFADVGALDPGFIVGRSQTFAGHSWVAGYSGLVAGAYRSTPTPLDVAGGGAFMMDAAVQVERLTSAYATGFYLLHGALNDAANTLTTSREAAFVNGLRAWIDFARAAQRPNTATGWGRLDTNAGIASNWFDFVGTWTTTADANRSSTQRKSTTIQNDSAKLRWYGDAVTIVLLGQPDTTGAAYAVADPGGTVASGTLSEQTNSLGSGAYGPVPVRLSGYGPGWHEVTLTKTDANGTILALDCLLVPSPTPLTTLVVKEPPVTGSRNSNIPGYNALIDATVAEAFTAGPAAPITVNPGVGTSWDTAVDLDSTGFHPSTRGYDKVWRRVVTALSAVPYRPSTILDQPPIVVAPLALADNFTRANSTFRPGVTSTGARPWAAAQKGSRFGISSNQLVQTGRGDYLGAVLVDSGKADTTISWTIGALGGGNLTLVFRAIDDDKFLMLFGGVLYKVNAQSFPEVPIVTGAGPTFGAGDTIQAVCAGSSITLRKNGVDAATYTEAVYSAGTRYGMGNFDGMVTGGLSAVSNT